MNRREFSLSVAALALAAAPVWRGVTALAGETSFNRERLVALAATLANSDFKPPPAVPEDFNKLGYDQYRDIRFRNELAFWLGEERGFTLELLHAGFIFRTPIEIYVVEGDIAHPIKYNTHLFDFGPYLEVPPMHDQPLFSGIRLRFPINTLAHADEFIVFQGASYFRAVGAGQRFGISARGLAIDTAEPRGEEFPFFRTIWIERPDRGAKTIAVHALLDSPSVTGAYSFRIAPGHATLMEVEATLFARNDLAHLGLAPLTSMYLFSSRERSRFQDFRRAVHDSDTLAIARSSGEWLLRPLANPMSLQVSAFAEPALRGFGLQQRASDYLNYRDLEARYELRPSTWVEPKGDWGEGQVELIEIPTDGEFNDNIVAFWRPRDPLPGGRSLSYSYWLTWGPLVSEKQLARVTDTAVGLTQDHRSQLFVVDFLPPMQHDAPVFLGADIKPQVSASKGKLKNVVGRIDPTSGGYRVSFELETSGVELSELRLVLTRGGQILSEAWVYRWTA